MKKIIALLVLLVATTVAPKAAFADATQGKFTILPGDTLGEIAARFHTDVSEWTDRNPGLDADMLKAGQRLNVPASIVAQLQKAPPDNLSEETVKVSKQEVLAKWKLRWCGYIAPWNVGAYHDAFGYVGDDISYDGGIFPVFENAGYVLREDWDNEVVPTVKTVRAIRDDPNHLEVIFLRDRSLEKNWRNTAWGDTMGNYKVNAEVPELCSWRLAQK